MARKKRREEMTFELTPLIDVVFLLLIFFMVSSVFKKDELALLLKLPQSETGEGEAKETKELTIELSGEKIAFEGKEISLENLTMNLDNKPKETLINLRVDGGVVYSRLVKVLDLLQQKKLENISLITEKEKK